MAIRVRDWAIMLYAASLWLVWPGVEAQVRTTQTVECPAGASCSLVAEWPIGGTAPPVEPPPVEPPPVEPPPVEPPPTQPPGAGREHFVTQCLQDGVVGCMEYASAEQVIGGAEFGSGVANSPSSPLTNDKCAWNGGDEGPCYPIFTGAACSDPADPATCALAVNDSNTCAEFDLLRAGYGQSQVTPLGASLWTPCYDTTANAMRFVHWRSLDSSLNDSSFIPYDPGETILLSSYALQFEIAFSAEMFHHPKGSNSSKLARLTREKDECLDDRLLDVRIGDITPDSISLFYLPYCSGVDGYPPTAASYIISETQAGTWFRVTYWISVEDDSVRFFVRNLQTGEIVWDHTATEDRSGYPYVMHAPNELVRARAAAHASSHKPCVGEECAQYPELPAYWLRRFILAHGTIEP